MRRDIEALCERKGTFGDSYSEAAKAHLRGAVAKLERLEDINTAARARGWSAMHRAGYYSNKREIESIKRVWRID